MNLPSESTPFTPAKNGIHVGTAYYPLATNDYKYPDAPIASPLSLEATNLDPSTREVKPVK